MPSVALVNIDGGVMVTDEPGNHKSSLVYLREVRIQLRRLQVRRQVALAFVFHTTIEIASQFPRVC